jgi:hypothetical protein
MCRNNEWLKAYAEKLLREINDDEPVEEDGDGDFYCRWGTAAVYVRVVGGRSPMVRVFAHAAWGVKQTAAVLREINELNTRTVSATVSIDDDTILVVQTLYASSLDRPTLAQAYHQVGTVADDIGTLAAAMFDGHTPFPAGELSADAE